MNAVATIHAQILEMDAKSIPYLNQEQLKPRKALIEQLNELGYTVGLGKGHKVVLRQLPEFNILPPVRDNF